jgi:hypothetical protein
MITRAVSFMMDRVRLRGIEVIVFRRVGPVVEDREKRKIPLKRRIGEFGVDRSAPHTQTFVHAGLGRSDLPSGFAADRFDFGEVREGTIEPIFEVTDADQAFNAAEEFDFVDGFGEEIVGAGLNASFEVGRLVERRDHEDRQVFGRGVFPYFATDFKTRKSRHHDVEQDEVGLERFDQLESFDAVGGSSNLARDVGEIRFEQFDVLEVVVGDQDLGWIL